jgi:quercetin dioxygenase-like cupin family protein
MCHVKVTRAAAGLADQTRVVLDSKRKRGEPDMGAEHDISELLYSIADGTDGQVLDALGPTVEFLTYQEDGELCTMRGVVPPGVAVPLHSHDDVEDFYILAGSQQVLTEGPDGLAWKEARAGDYVRVPPGTPHAHRNVTSLPAVDLIITTTRMGNFFKEIGRPVTGSPQPPTPEALAHFIATAEKYGYKLGTPEENAAVGIELK